MVFVDKLRGEDEEGGKEGAHVVRFGLVSLIN